nr:FkbM family methyltransferase [uncultured Methanobacterium sp.]
MNNFEFVYNSFYGFKSIFSIKNWSEIVKDYFRYYLGFENEKNIIVQFKNGIKLKAARKSKKEVADIGLIVDIWFSETYNPPGFEINKDDVVIDIGAHKGYFSIYAAYNAGKTGKVHSFEPSPESFQYLIDNINMNELNNVFPFKAGVCGENGVKQLNVSLNSASHSMHVNGAEIIEIECLTLQDIFKMNHITKCDFLKIDCEGAEYEILYNTPPEILGKIDRISLEHHILEGYDYHQLADFLEKNGFQVRSTSKSVYAKKIDKKIPSS